MKHLLCACALVLAAAGFWSCSSSSSDDDREAVKIEKTSNTALLLCSFGSTYMQAQETYDKIIADYKRAYPSVDIYMAFTSGTIVSRVYAEIGIAYAQPDVWFTALGNAGYETVYVQSLHVIPGEEYHKLMDETLPRYLTGKFPNIKVAQGACLLESDADVDAVAEIVYAYYKERLDNGEAVALMGHGNTNSNGNYESANVRYREMEEKLQALSGKANIFVGTVDWEQQMFSHVREGLIAFAESEGKTYAEVVVSLAPFMSITGDHAQNDLLGGLEDGQTYDSIDPYEDDEEAEYSWVLKLEKLGFSISEDGSVTDEANFNVVGLGDHSAIRAIWVQHMREGVAAMAE